jgi:hypothetical protein
MNLPAHFLADLPPEASLGPGMITEACRALRRNRERTLQSFSTEHISSIIAETARLWLLEDYPFRKMAFAPGSDATGFSPPILRKGLDAFFREWTMENIHSLLVQDLGTAQRLDHFSTPETSRISHSAVATAPEVLVQIVPGNLPVSAMSSLLLGLLIRSAQFIKCAAGGAFFPRLLAHSLVDTEPSLAACLEIAEWPGGTRELEEALYAEADLVTATGSDETLTAIRGQLPLGLRFVGYGHRVSFGYVTRDALNGFSRAQTIDRSADDVIAWDQCGCLSPHLFYVESGGSVSAESFAELLADALAKREETHPRRQLGVRDAAMIALKRDFYEIRAAASPDTHLWRSSDNTAWTVVFEGDPRFQLSCLNRFVYVKPVSDLVDALRGADSVRGKVSTVGVAGPEHRMPELATALARWGVTRVCPLGRMQAPPLTWRHDGRSALGDLITWTDWER